MKVNIFRSVSYNKWWLMLTIRKKIININYIVYSLPPNFWGSRWNLVYPNLIIIIIIKLLISLIGTEIGSLKKSLDFKFMMKKIWLRKDCLCKSN